MMMMMMMKSGLQACAVLRRRQKPFSFSGLFSVGEEEEVGKSFTIKVINDSHNQRLSRDKVTRALQQSLSGQPRHFLPLEHLTAEVSIHFHQQQQFIKEKIMYYYRFCNSLTIESFFSRRDFRGCMLHSAVDISIDHFVVIRRIPRLYLENHKRFAGILMAKV